MRYAWIPAGHSVVDACSNEPTDETAAFYCPADDTIYLSEPFVEAVRDGRLSQWPSGDQTDGALGDMAVAYVIAHEEGHNIQNELGWDQGSTSTEGLELDADCLAGAWAADAAARGVVDKQDLARGPGAPPGSSATTPSTTPSHHGTPAQRQAAFTNGYDDLSSCRQYLSD